ncbi:hypothetical protein Sste5344_008524 [Sporothrix stenoceras]
MAAVVAQMDVNAPNTSIPSVDSSAVPASDTQDKTVVPSVDTADKPEDITTTTTAPAVGGDAAPVDAELSITLECSLCPKTPKFSDASHLLTHISSKAHLHQKFSTELKAKSDSAASVKLKKFDKWYEDSGIDRLLAERLSAKAKPRPPRRSRASAATATPKPKARKSASAVDFIKRDADAAQSAYRTPDHLPPLAHWNTAPTAGRDNGYAVGRDSAQYLHGTLYNTPDSARQRSGSYSAYPGDANGNGGAIGDKPIIGNYGVGVNLSTAPASEAGVSLVDEVTKLKGVIWPGMDLFDAATIDQKRKRNQRKDDAAISLLKHTSLTVTPTEQVWGPLGDIRKERDIYASPSSVEGSPPSTPPPRNKRKSRGGGRSSAANVAAGNHITPLTMKTEGAENGEPPAKRRNVRGSGARAASAKARSTRSSTQGTIDQPAAATSKPPPPTRETSAEIEEAVYALQGNHKPPPRPTFNVYYEGTTNSQALQQLDSNLAISEGSSYFKTNTTSSHFFAPNGRQSPHLPPYHTMQPPNYANGYQGMTNNTLNPLNTQPRSGGTNNLYPPFDNQMFNPNTGTVPDGTNNATSFHAPPSDNRRMGYGGFGMDATGSPFGYDSQRDPTLRDNSYTDPTFQGTGRLFEM